MPLQASWTRKNDKYGSGTSTSVSTPAFSQALSNPSIIIAGVWIYTSGTVPTPTDTAGNTYVDCGAGQVATYGSSSYIELFYALNTHTTSSNVLTVSYGSSIEMHIYAAEFTGGLTSSPVDVHSLTSDGSTGTGGGQNMTTGSATTTLNTELIIGLTQNLNNWPTAGTGFTQTSEANLEYEVQASLGPVAATWSDSANNLSYGAILATFKPAAQSYTATPTETNTASDSVARLHASYASPVESQSASDSLARQAAHFAAPAELDSTTDTLKSGAAHFAYPLETNTASDSLARQASYWRGDCIALNWAPPTGAAGNSAYSYNIYRGTSSGNETGPINSSPVDAGCAGPGAGGCVYVDYGPQAGVEYYYEVTSVYQGVQSPFSAETGTVIPANAILETNTAGDALVKQSSYVRAALESSAASDSLARLETLGRGFSEAHTTSDSLARLGTFARGAAETNPAGDSLAAADGFLRGMAEEMTISDAAAAVWTKYLGQPRHRFTAPEKTKTGETPGKTKTGEAPVH